MKRYLIERELTGVGSLAVAELKAAAQQSNAASPNWRARLSAT